jgi:hypothetical protein
VFILMLVWVIQFDIKSPLVKISSHNTQCELLQMNMQKIFSIRFFYVCVQWCCLLQKKWNYVSLEPWIRTISNKMRAWIYIFSVFFVTLRFFVCLFQLYTFLSVLRIIQFSGVNLFTVDILILKFFVYLALSLVFDF